MKKIYLPALLLACALPLSACSATHSTQETEAASSRTGDLIADAADYVKPGDFKTLALQKTVTTVTAEEAADEMQTRQYNYATEIDVTDGAADGDTILFDYTATVNGEAETVEQMTIDLGYSEYGEAFDQHLVGCKAGDDLTFSVSFTEDDYVVENWIDETVDFTVHVQRVSRLDVPELTDDFLQKTIGYDTMQEYQDTLQQEMEDKYNLQNEQIAIEEALTQAVECSTFDGYPQDIYDQINTIVRSSYQNMAEMFGVDETEFYAMSGIDDIALDEEVMAEVNQRLLVSDLILSNQLSLTDRDLDALCDNLYDFYQYDSPEDMSDSLGDELVWYAAKHVAGLYILDTADVTLVNEAAEDELGYVETEDDDIALGLADDSFTG